MFAFMVQTRFLIKGNCFYSFVCSHGRSQPADGGLDGGVPMAILVDKRQGFVKKCFFRIPVFD